MGKKVVIVGGGVAGLVAAWHLEQAGLAPVLVEAEGAIGGRLRTTVVDGFQLDHGFQVLLTGYQEAQRYLDFEALQLGHFAAGAVIFAAGRQFNISDPRREPASLLPLLFSPVGTLGDKLRILRLAQQLSRKSPAELFGGNPGTTLAYLQQLGFSKTIIDRFFRPFFAGIFLEDDLKTPASMFRFVFKMFSTGTAALPQAGIAAIPQQLLSRLERTTILLNHRVTGIAERQVLIGDRAPLPFDAAIIATDPREFLPQTTLAPVAYHHTSNFYFRSTGALLQRPAIALVADPENPINSFCTPNAVAKGYAPVDQTLVSITLKARFSSRNTTPAAIAADLRRLLRQPDLPLEHLATFEIPRALPVREKLDYSQDQAPSAPRQGLFFAGDHLLNASLDAALRSGRIAAETLLAQG